MKTIHEHIEIQGSLKNFLNWLFDYKDGNLTWKNNVSKYNKIGKKVNMNILWYPVVWVISKQYLCHRVVYEMHNGEIPKGMCIDHIDGDISNNKIENLRLATNSTNQMNRLASTKNPTGIKGVTINRMGKFEARCTINGKGKYLGVFDIKEDAALAYANYSKAKQGEFYRDNLKGG